jgi:hypothetical protein
MLNYLEIKVRGDEMKPNPQEKCMIIRTIGSRTLSAQFLPSFNEAKVITDK